MKLKINLSGYSLDYLFGDRVFQDSFLLSREVIKKAYQEGLYYISSKKNIYEFLKKKNHRTMIVFAGIPSFSEVCTELSPQKELYALKMTLDYEVLANFHEENGFLVHDDVDFLNIEEVKLYRNIKNNLLVYEEEKWNNAIVKEEEVAKTLGKELQNYHYGITKALENLNKKVTQFLQSEKSKPFLENEESLEFMKEIYEMLYFVKW